jgi:hypothetical protein
MCPYLKAKFGLDWGVSNMGRNRKFAGKIFKQISDNYILQLINLKIDFNINIYIENSIFSDLLENIFAGWANHV